MFLACLPPILISTGKFDPEITGVQRTCVRCDEYKSKQLSLMDQSHNDLSKLVGSRNQLACLCPRDDRMRGRLRPCKLSLLVLLLAEHDIDDVDNLELTRILRFPENAGTRRASGLWNMQWSIQDCHQ